ncbi:MAG: DUF3108 domain-containing protein [Hylemonella sp.]|uniref:DUF3108 domain-containing protein n=1 Tax=Hylemonella sp. TaxID=2066020 RepID=UPI0022BCE250|nr:DUF3108 domain-containing protein [Hylemonella sp.]MCZ8253328.1 DUF3108 domain-containing protein [Hylemonella sp.]
MPHAWRRLLLCALLALAAHLLLLALFGPRVQAPHVSTIAQPLVYALESAPVRPPPVPTATRAPRRPRPATALPAPPVLAEAPAPEPAAETEPPSPEPTPEPAPAVSEATPLPAAAPPEPAPPPASIPGSLRLKYGIQGEVKGMAYQASGELLWAHDGQDYEARLEVGAFLLGSRVQGSRGRITAEGLQPQRFTDRSRRERITEFDHAQAQVRFSEGAPAAALSAGTQDPLSVFMQLASQLASQPGLYPPGTELALQVAGLRGIDTWRLVIGAEETLTLPGGELLTRKLSRVVEGKDDLRVDVWLAPALNWLPARIRLTQASGDTIDQQWRGSEAP